MSLSLALAGQAIEKKVCSRATLGGLRRGETSRRKIYRRRCSVEGGTRVRRASRLCSWIVKIADLYVVFIAAYSRGRYEREIQALPGTAASSRGLFFFQKVAYMVSPFEPTSVFRSGELSRTPETHGAQTIARRRKTFTPRGGPRGGFLVGVCTRPVPRNPTKRGSPITFSRAQKGKCTVALMAEKCLGFLTRSSGYRRSRCIFSKMTFYPIILKTLISRIAGKIARIFIYIFIIYIIYICVI